MVLPNREAGSATIKEDNKIPELPVSGELEPYDMPTLPERAHQ
jgi:hypothetical protein